VNRTSGGPRLYVNPQFGGTVEISGGQAFVGAPGHSTVERYSIAADGRRLLPLQQIASAHAGVGTQFGISIAASGREAIIGARLAPADGLAVVMRETPGSASGGSAGAPPNASAR
jgi:hypothetical protein